MANFFEQQSQARNATKYLVILYGLAVLCIVAAVVLVTRYCFTFIRFSEPAFDFPYASEAIAAGITILIIGLGTWRRMYQIGGSGDHVAVMLGGVPVDHSTTDPLERRLLNVVEEMAIASGITIPRVYILSKESGINAFAAGMRPGEAVVGVTRGTLEQLTRDELQGVIAHEFSHIFNGDMRLNLRLMGILGGIVTIATIGKFLIKSQRRSSGSRKGGAPILAFIGLALLIIGYIGVFFARMIKAAVSRQREYLADASAVQYTRNPGGIGGALMKIRGHDAHSNVRALFADEASHLFFGSVSSFFALFSTHPSLEERIKRISPYLMQPGAWTAHSAQERSASFTTSMSSEAAAGFSEAMTSSEAIVQESDSPEEEIKTPRSQTEAAAGRASTILSSVGSVSSDDIAAARSRLDKLPVTVREELKRPEGAAAVVIALFLQSETGSSSQNAMVREALGDAALKLSQEMHRDLESAVHDERLTLLELALPALKSLKDDARRTFLILCRDLVHADGRYDLFEYVALTLLDHQLFGARRHRRPRPRLNGNRTINDISIVISAIAYAGTDDFTRAKAAFDSGADAIQVRNTEELTFRSPDECRLPSIADAIDRLSYLEPVSQRSVIDACVRTVIHDRVINQEEAELLKVICVVLEAPLPALAV